MAISARNYLLHVLRYVLLLLQLYSQQLFSQISILFSTTHNSFVRNIIGRRFIASFPGSNEARHEKFGREKNTLLAPVAGSAGSVGANEPHLKSIVVKKSLPCQTPRGQLQLAERRSGPFQN